MYTTLCIPYYTITFRTSINLLYFIYYIHTLGIITIKDLADSSFSIMDLGGKKGFIQNVTNRKGVPEGMYTRVLLIIFANHRRVCTNVSGCVYTCIGTRIRTVAEAPKTNQKLGVEVSFPILYNTSHIRVYYTVRNTMFIL